MAGKSSFIQRRLTGWYALKLTSEGFTKVRSRVWAKKAIDSYLNDNKYSKSQKKWALDNGFMPGYVKKFDITESNKNEFLSEKEYQYVQPVNGLYDKWLYNNVIAKMVLFNIKDYFPKHYYQIHNAEGQVKIFALDDCPDVYTEDKAGIISLIKDEKKVLVSYVTGREMSVLSYEDGEYSFLGKTTKSDDDVIKMISKYAENPIITELPADKAQGIRNVVKVTCVNKDMVKPIVCDAFYTELQYEKDPDKMHVIDIERGTYNTESGQCSIKYWDEIKALLCDTIRFAPQLVCLEAEIIINEDGFRIINMENMPAYSNSRPFSAEFTAFIKKKISIKERIYATSKARRQELATRFRRLVRMRFTAKFFPKGLEADRSTVWIAALWQDIRSKNGMSLKEKLWAYKRGFLSYRIPQYGITDKNIKTNISDFEYIWLRHINKEYKTIFEDKISIKYVMHDFRECFPEYYYHVITYGNDKVILPMMDIDKKVDACYDDIFKLVEEKGIIALKPESGSHGNGFFRFAYSDGKYYLNDKEATRDEVIAILEDKDNQYLITEYINNHPDFKKIYSGSVNTLRIMVFKKDGKTPQIGNTYMRFGSKATGAVDNMSAGGMFVEVDEVTGKYGDAKIITNQAIKPCPCHPDSGVLIEGVIPNWDYVKDVVIKMAKVVRQIEWFGFDIAITEEGIKIPEINRSPEYPKIENLNQETIDYLLMKLDEKKKLVGYEKSKKTLVKLPKR
ncbi:MAG: sugar-transfer associated ATP-grasp domain-containing protein [Firmicutes bacterium]|nr:sugar-transfer associated ATP-grasp domain-containing protein [Bacillota bacterium]